MVKYYTIIEEYYLTGRYPCICCLRLINVRHGKCMFTSFNSVLLVLVLKQIFNTIKEEMVQISHKHFNQILENLT